MTDQKNAKRHFGASGQLVARASHCCCLGGGFAVRGHRTRWVLLRDEGCWAIDLLGQQGDPVYAAGAGIFHIGAIDTSCKTASSPDSPGTWVWIDHGGGVVSRYHHLDAVTATEGALVTPSTQIGRMGHSGDFAPCTTNYLHFEVRHGGVKGTRVDPGQLAGCLGTSRQSYPQVFGYSSWNDVPNAY